MKKYMLALAAFSLFCFAGCDKEAGTSSKTETKVQNPDGSESKTTEKVEKKTETSGGDAATSPAI